MYLGTVEITVFAYNHLLMLCMNDVIEFSFATGSCRVTQLFSFHFEIISFFPPHHRRENCTSCLEHSDECIWCESSQTCDQFAPYLAVNSYAQCKSWKENHQQEGMQCIILLDCNTFCDVVIIISSNLVEQ